MREHWRVRVGSAGRAEVVAVLVLAMSSAAGCGRRGSGGDLEQVQAAATNGPRSSPFDPPKENGHTFVTDSGAFLDTGCTFRSGGPLVFNIEVNRVLGPLNADGTLANADVMIANGLLSPTATLSLPMFDVDSDFVPGPDDPTQPEVDVISFNGEQLGTLNGGNNIWKLNTFEVDIHKVKFAVQAPASSPTPALNQVRIDIDTANPGEVWCTAVDWGSLKFAAASPVIAVHGNGSSGQFFVNNGLVDGFNAVGMLVDTSIQLATGPVDVNGNDLGNKIPAVAHSLGADQVHLVAHSKGGLDTRQYLAVYQPTQAGAGGVEVLSFSTLGSPHNGSVGADLLVKRQELIAKKLAVGFSGFPMLTGLVASRMAVNPGHAFLTTEWVADFNRRTGTTGFGSLQFNAVGADADKNDDKKLDRSEYQEFLADSAELRKLDSTPLVGPSLVDVGINTAYQVLRNTASIDVQYGTTLFGKKTATLVAVNPPSPLGNDVLVTIPSALGENSVAARVDHPKELKGADGRNHSSIANADTAAVLIPWLKQVDQQKGGLQ